jgi:hypothetical protein
LYIPASATCAAGNVLAAYSICRTCHFDGGSGPFQLITYADVKAQASSEADAISGTPPDMPLSGTFAPAANCSPTGTTTSCKNVMLNWLNAGAVGVTDLNGVCP